MGDTVVRKTVPDAAAEVGAARAPFRHPQRRERVMWAAALRLSFLGGVPHDWLWQSPLTKQSATGR